MGSLLVLASTLHPCLATPLTPPAPVTRTQPYPTEGAMLTEVLCEGCECVSFVSDTHRVVRDTASGYFELYDLTRDPLETEDVFDIDDPSSQDYAHHFEAYDAVRAAAR